MQTTNTMLVCDGCLNNNTDDSPRTAEHSFIFQTSADEAQRFRVDLCGAHAKNLSLVEVVALARAWWDAPPPRIGRPLVDCEYCGVAISAGSGLALHTKAKHPEHYQPAGHRD